LHHLPNIISIIRILLIFPIVYLLYQELWLNALILIGVAGVSDGLDGFLARAFHWQSRLGAILDPIADKALLVILFVVLAHKGIIPLWLTLLVVARDVVILGGATVYHFVTRSLEMAPLFISKINTAVQIAYIVVVMYHLAIEPIPPNWLESLMYLTAFTTFLSGVMYVVIWSGYTRTKLANKEKQKS